MRRQLSHPWLLVSLAAVAALACGRGGQGERRLTPNELRAQLVAGTPAGQDLVIVEVGGYGKGTVSSPELALQCTTWTESALSALCWGFVSRDVQRVTVVAAPDGASELQTWAGACGGTATSCTPARQRLLDIGVSFAPKDETIPPPVAHQLSVEVAGEGEGAVATADTPLDCTRWTESSLSALCFSLVPNPATPRQVTLRASAAPGSVFAGWSGACQGESATCTVTMDRSRSVEARFATVDAAAPPPATQMLLVEVGGTGDGDVSASVGLECTEWTESALSRLCSAQVPNTDPPTEVTLTAAPRQGSRFAGWSGACAGRGDCIVRVDHLVQVYAEFVPAYQCTHVIGFSQTHGWYTRGFETVVDDAGWQELWYPGASIDLWANAAYAGWSAALVSPCAEGADDPDRVLLTVSGAENPDPSWWRDQIRAVAAIVRQKYPSVRQIVLQPVVGGPRHVQCDPAGHRASANHPVIDQAIAAAVAVEPDLVAGASPEVTACSDYTDAMGHMTTTAYAEVAARLGAFYARW